MMDRVAQSLTALVRARTGENATGTTWTMEPYVHARWQWVILPLALLAITLVFLITTIVLSAIQHIPTWRSSALPSLVYALDETTVAAMALHGPRVKTLEKEAGKHIMAMSAAGPWRLEGTRMERTGTHG